MDIQNAPTYLVRQHSSVKNLNTTLLSSILSIQSTLGLSDETMNSILEIDKSEHDRVRSGLGHYSVNHLFFLSKKLGISMQVLFEGRIDLAELHSRFVKQTPIFPERYLSDAHRFSYARSVLGILTYLDATHGWGYTQRYLKAVQVSPVLLSNPEAKVSSLLGLDLLTNLREEGLIDPDFQRMGSMTFFSNRSTQLGKAIQSSQNFKATHICALDEYSDQLDLLCNYRLIRVDDFGCTLEIHPKSNVSDAFKVPVFGTRETCLFRQGVTLSFGLFLNQKMPSLTERKCMYLGDSSCIYEIDWSGVGWVSSI